MQGSASPPAMGFTKLPESQPHLNSPRDSPPQDFLLASEQQLSFCDQLRGQLQVLRSQYRSSPPTSPGCTHSLRDNHLQPLPPPNFLPRSGMPLPPPLGGHTIQPPHLPMFLTPSPLLAPLPPAPCLGDYPVHSWLLGSLFPPGFPGGHDSPPFRKPRTKISPGQLLKLEQAFKKNQHVVGAEKKQLAQSVNLSEKRVGFWFQNRRVKHRRQQKRQQQEGEDGKSVNKQGDGEEAEAH